MLKGQAFHLPRLRKVPRRRPGADVRIAGSTARVLRRVGIRSRASCQGFAKAWSSHGLSAASFEGRAAAVERAAFIAAASLRCRSPLRLPAKSPAAFQGAARQKTREAYFLMPSA